MVGVRDSYFGACDLDCQPFSPAPLAPRPWFPYVPSLCLLWRNAPQMFLGIVFKYNSKYTLKHGMNSTNCSNAAFAASKCCCNLRPRRSLLLAVGLSGGVMLCHVDRCDIRSISNNFWLTVLQADMSHATLVSRDQTQKILVHIRCVPPLTSARTRRPAMLVAEYVCFVNRWIPRRAGTLHRSFGSGDSGQVQDCLTSSFHS